MAENPFDTRDPIAEGLPLNDDALGDFLKAGPQGIKSGKPALPQPHFNVSAPMPKVVPPPEMVAEEAPRSVVEETEEEDDEDDGPDEKMRKRLILPSEKDTAIMKQYYPILKVLPLPFVSPEKGKFQCYVIRPLTRMEWRKSEEKARELSEKKNIPADDIFMEDIVLKAVVWPKFDGTMMASLQAGLVGSIFGVVQNISLFFDPEKLMQLTFNL